MPRERTTDFGWGNRAAHAWSDPERHTLRCLLDGRLAETLTPRQRVMCRLWAGSESRYPMTLAEIGSLFGVRAASVWYQIQDARVQFGVYYGS